MGHRHFDAAGNEFRVYSTASDNKQDRGDYSGITRQQAGELVDLAAKFFVTQGTAKNYSEAVHAVLEKDTELAKAYLGE